MTFAGQDGARLGGEVFHAKRCSQNPPGLVAPSGQDGCLEFCEPLETGAAAACGGKEHRGAAQTMLHRDANTAFNPI